MIPAGKEIMAQRIVELIKETLSKKKTSTIPLHWKQDIDKRTAPTWICDTGSSTDGTAGNMQGNQSLSIECDNKNSNLNRDNPQDATPLNSALDGSVNKVILPIQDKKCLKAKDEDFYGFRIN